MYNFFRYINNRELCNLRQSCNIRNLRQSCMFFSLSQNQLRNIQKQQMK